MGTVQLSEYESKTVRLTSQQASQLESVGRGIVNVRPGSSAGHYRIKANSKVGTVVLKDADLQLLIRPKIPLDNLFVLLEVGLPTTAWHREAFDYQTTPDLLPSIVAFYARTLETTLARGLLRSYRHINDRLVALRGRIDIAGHFRQPGLRLPLPCEYDEYTPDISENRYAKAAARMALRAPGVKGEDRRRLLRQIGALEDVADAAVRADALDRVTFTRLNEYYLPALRLARLLLENFTLMDRHGDKGASSFILDMKRIFEDFVTQRLRRELRGRIEVRSQSQTYLDVDRTVPIRPDLVFRHQGREVYVADIKYKLTYDARARIDDYYQMLAYTTALDLPEGVLIYCQSEGGSTADRPITVRHARKTLHTLPIDLSGPPEAIDRSLKQAASWLTTRISPKAAQGDNI